MIEKMLAKSKVPKVKGNEYLTNTNDFESFINKENKIKKVKIQKNSTEKSKIIFKNINSSFINILFIKYILIIFL